MPLLLKQNLTERKNMSNVLILPDAVDKLSPQQKLLAKAGVVVAGATFIYLLPSMNAILTNIYAFGIMVVPPVLAYAFRKPLWDFTKDIIWRLTKAWIGLDTIAQLERYFVYSGEQLEEARMAYTAMLADLTGLKSQIQEREASYKLNKNRALEALNSKDNVQAEVYGGMAMQDEELLRESLIPSRDNAEKRTGDMKKIVEVFDAKRKTLRYKIDAQTQKRKILLSQYKGLQAFSKFLNSDDINARMYMEAEKQLVEEFNQFTAGIEVFQNNIQPTLQEAKIDASIASTKVSEFLATLK
jgi:hypothetical protein